MRQKQSQGTAVACALLAAMLYAVGTPLYFCRMSAR